MFERFTERARQVCVLGEDEARTLKHSYIGTEHLLLGLLREEEGLAARVLGSLAVDIAFVRSRIREVVAEGDVVTVGQIPFTPRAKKVLELALREALSLGHNYIGTEHILLGFVRENEGVGAHILLELGITPDVVRDEIIRMLSGPRAAKAGAEAVDQMKADLRVLQRYEALQQIAAVLGPTVDCRHIKCEGCQAEMAEALRLAQEAIA